jgi:hypothetical protein
MNAQNIGVVDKVNYLGVTLETTRCRTKQKTLAQAKGYKPLVATDKCISVIHSIKLQMENYTK